MNRKGSRITALLLLFGLFSTTCLGVYGLTSTNSAGKIDAIASASKASPKPTTSTTPKSTTKTPAKTTPLPVPLPLPVPVPAVPVPVPVIPAVNEASSALIVLGKAIDLTGSPIYLTADGEAMLPLRKLAEALGYQISWNAPLKAAVLQSPQEFVVINEGQLNYLQGATTRVFRNKPQIARNSLYIPSGFISNNPAFTLTQTPAAITIDLAANALNQSIATKIEGVESYPLPDPVVNSRSHSKTDDSDDDEDDDD